MNLLRTSLCALLLLAAGVPAWAQTTREAAAVIAQQETGGRVLSVEPADAGGRPAWRVKVLTPRGEVRVVLVDAATGRPF